MSNESKELENFATLKGGKKRMWLELHKDLVLQFYEEFGEDTTRQLFHLKKITLDSFLTYAGNDNLRRPFSKVDRIIDEIKILKAEFSEFRQDSQSLKELFERFQQSVGEQLISNFFMPLLQAGFRVDADLNLKQEDKLSLEDPIHDPLTLQSGKEKVGE